MTQHSYGRIIKLIYTYGNFVITFLMVINLLIFFVNLKVSKLFIFPIIVSIVVIYIVNRFYFLIYKTLPRKILLDGDKIVCSSFIFNKQRVETIKLNEITSISGGIFDGRLNGIIKIKDKRNITIAISHRISDSTKLIAGILSKVNKDIYEHSIESLKKLTDEIVKRKNARGKN